MKCWWALFVTFPYLDSSSVSSADTTDSQTRVWCSRLKGFEHKNPIPARCANWAMAASSRVGSYLGEDDILRLVDAFRGFLQFSTMAGRTSA
jgi:hypothetical protein